MVAQAAVEVAADMNLPRPSSSLGRGDARHGEHYFFLVEVPSALCPWRVLTIRIHSIQPTGLALSTMPTFNPTAKTSYLPPLQKPPSHPAGGLPFAEQARRRI